MKNSRMSVPIRLIMRERPMPNGDAKKKNMIVAYQYNPRMYN